MRVLVAYASRHRATQGIGERIGKSMLRQGLDVDVQAVTTVKSGDGSQAFVVGSAAYMFHRLKEATGFVRGNWKVLSARPIWLFGSGPLGTEPLNAQGRDQKIAAVPKGLAELKALLGSREHRVFFGAYQRERKPIGLAERFMSVLAAAPEGLPEGDFRDWTEIDSWGASIARQFPSGDVPQPGTAGPR
jgi:menaquinone-dependent protoporphyrinogen oxidase